MNDYRINLEIFSGPLDLLLYLVRREEVDIYDIPIARITEEYLKYVEMIKLFDVDLASEFLVMAATLMEIKSAMLLPAEQVQGETEAAALDPRRELVRQLLEYKKFKDAANLLAAQAEYQHSKFPRTDNIITQLAGQTEPQIDLDQASIWDLLGAFDTVMKSIGEYMDISRIQDDTPIDLYQIEMLDRLQREGNMTFERLFEGRTNRLVLIGMFLALLELVRNKLITAEQDDHGGAIYLRAITDEPAQQAVKNAIMMNEQERLAAEASRQSQEYTDEPTQEHPVMQDEPVADDEDDIDLAGTDDVGKLPEIPYRIMELPSDNSFKERIYHDGKHNRTD